MDFKVKTAPATYPITKEELKEHLRLPASYTAEDNRLDFFIKTATMFAQRITQRQLITSTWYAYLTKFPGSRKPLLINKCPVSAITAITYTDTVGESQTIDLTNYVKNYAAEPAIVQPKINYYWPTAANEEGNICIEFTSGYASAAAIPENVTAGIFIVCADLWANRESIVIGRSVNKIPFTAEQLFELERVMYHGR